MPGGHYLSYKGVPIMPIGDSVTQAWMESLNFDQNAYIDALASRGIKLLMLWSFIAPQEGEDKRFGYDSPELAPWASTGNHSWDLLKLNDRYFRRLRDLCTAAREKDILVLITIWDGWTKRRFGTHPFNKKNGGPLLKRSQFVQLHNYANEMPSDFNSNWSRTQKNQYFQECFCDRLISELRGLDNVMYEIFNEGEWYNTTDLSRYQVHFLNFIKTRTNQLTIVNDDHVKGADFRCVTNCDIISHHGPIWDNSISPLNSFSHYASNFNGIPPKPFIFSEPVPAFERKSHLQPMKRLMWGTVLAGAGFVVQNDTSFGWDPNAAWSSKSKIRDQMYDLEGHCSRFFNESGISFWEMRPDGSLSSTNICLANPGNEYIVFIESGGPCTVDLSACQGKNLTVRWYDPDTGKFQSEKNISGGSSAHCFNPPSHKDWILHVKNGSPAEMGK